MKRQPRETPAEVPITPAVLHILLSLADGERHGYAIMQEVERRTEGTLVLGPGTLYRSIKRMLAAELISEAGAQAGAGPQRRNYRLTDAGRQLAVAETRRMEAIVSWARSSKLLWEEGT